MSVYLPVCPCGCYRPVAFLRASHDALHQSAVSLISTEHGLDRYGLPIMLAVIFAKWVGDFFNEGLYDIHIELKHVPLLGWNPPQVHRHTVIADDIMSHKVCQSNLTPNLFVP